MIFSYNLDCEMIKIIGIFDLTTRLNGNKRVILYKIKNQNDYNHFSNNYKHFSRLNQDLFRKILKISIFKNSEKRKDRTTWLFSPSPSHQIPSKFKKSAALGHFIFTPLQDKGCCGVLQERKRGGSVPSGSKKERRKS